MNPSPIAVFDIDGTLTDTMDVDVECYEAAILEITGVVVPASWPEMEEVTDSGILAASCKLQGKPPPSTSTKERIAKRVAELLQDAHLARPERFSPTPGARSVFGHLTRSGWRVAMATGAWRPSALFKLAAARIPTDGVPLATSSDFPRRRDIIAHAVRMVAGRRRAPVVYVGDGIWDGRAATSLGHGFVGVGPPDNVAALTQAGASAVVPNLEDEAQLIGHLQCAIS